MEVGNDFLVENIGVAKIIGLFEALISEPGNLEVCFVAVDAGNSSLPNHARPFIDRTQAATKTAPALNNLSGSLIATAHR